MSGYCLEMKNIQKRFVSLKALDGANFRLRTGEVHALLGINGAGKSTLIKILSGIYNKNGGTILINGEETEINRPEDAMRAGISTVYQDPQMIESFTGYENIYLGRENDADGLFASVSRKKLKNMALELLERYPLDIDINKPVYLLSAIEREIIAILRALSNECNILILDEPTSILTEKEKEILFDVVRLLKNNGVSIIYITHHLDEVSQICDSFTVFRNGKEVAEVQIENNYVDPDYIAELMLGKKMDSLYPEKGNATAGEVVLDAQNIQLESKLKNISLQVKKNEIFGVFGLVGSGIDELSKIIFGAMKKDSGTILMNGKTLDDRSPKTVVNDGVFLVPGDRKKEGNIGGLSVANNITLAKLSRVLGKSRLIKFAEEDQHANEMVKHLEIATTSIHKDVEQLSGGNQQKVVIAKGLFTQADLYIFAEPTVGVDVGAKFAIYQTMRDLSKDAAVLMISSDPEEILGNADRVMVMQKGESTLEVAAEDTSLKEMLVHAVSSKELHEEEVKDVE